MASIKEFYGDNTQLYDSIIKKVNFNLRCCIPGIVQSYNPSQCMAEIQPAIREEIVSEDNSVSYMNLPLLINVPILFPHAMNAGITFPLKQGDEVLVFFSDLSYDKFWESGTIQNPVEVRRHDLSDGLAIPTMISNAKVVNFSQASDEDVIIRNGFSTYIILSRDDIMFVAGDTYTTLSQIVTKLEMLENHYHIAPAGGGSTSSPKNS